MKNPSIAENVDINNFKKKEKIFLQKGFQYSKGLRANSKGLNFFIKYSKSFTNM